MNVILKNATHLLWAAALCIFFGIESPAQAQRTHWEGRNSAGVTSVFKRDFSGTWTETVTHGQSKVKYNFVQRENRPDQILLYDASRNVWVALFNNRMDYYEHSESRWVTYYAGSWQQPRPAARFAVQFTHMKILDDKEGGSGDWRLKASVGGYRDVTIVDKMEGATGATLGFRSNPMIVAGPTATVSATVFEHDGGIGAKWEYVGQREIMVRAPGEYQLEFNNAEGHVIVYFRVTAL